MYVAAGLLLGNSLLFETLNVSGESACKLTGLIPDMLLLVNNFDFFGNLFLAVQNLFEKLD